MYIVHICYERTTGNSKLYHQTTTRPIPLLLVEDGLKEVLIHGCKENTIKEPLIEIKYFQIAFLTHKKKYLFLYFFDFFGFFL